MYEWVLKHGVIIDGTGNPLYYGDIGIRDGFIEKIGIIEEEKSKTIDLKGFVVSPGFIDTHSHSDLYLIHEPSSLPKIMQGITTEIIGQDGLGEAPIRSENVAEWRRYLAGLNGDPPIDWSWRSFDEYLKTLEASRPSVNVASLVGHGNLRLHVMGMEDRKPTNIEMKEMKILLHQSLEEGAVGLSTGLIYAPCIFAHIDELIELCQVVADHNRVFVVHMRDEGDGLLESIQEVLDIAKVTGVHVHISHFKSSGKRNWGRSKIALEKLEKAHNDGLKISYDQYPYTAGSTFLSSLLPSWVHEGGVEKLLERLRDTETREQIIEEYTDLENMDRIAGWNNVLVTYVESEKNKLHEGKSLQEISENRTQKPVETLMDIVLEEENMASMALFTMSEEDVVQIIKHPLGMICTDGLLLGKPHPRAYGAFPRVMGRYIREQKVSSLEEAIRRMTSYPSRIFQLGKRGLIVPGYKADLVVFDPETVIDTGTYQEPRRHPLGIQHVLVSGRFIVRDGEYTGKNHGEIIKLG
jgi:N-acyl-D-amino-acid deacylase